MGDEILRARTLVQLLTERNELATSPFIQDAYFTQPLVAGRKPYLLFDIIPSDSRETYERLMDGFERMYAQAPEKYDLLNYEFYMLPQDYELTMHFIPAYVTIDEGRWPLLNAAYNHALNTGLRYDENLKQFVAQAQRVPQKKREREVIVLPFDERRIKRV